MSIQPHTSFYCKDTQTRMHKDKREGTKTHEDATKKHKYTEMLVT